MQLIGLTDQAEKDEIVKSVMDLKSADIEEGYTLDAVVSRQVVGKIAISFPQFFWGCSYLAGSFVLFNLIFFFFLPFGFLV